MPRQGSSTSTDKGGASTPKEKGLMVSMWARALGEKSNILLENDEREGVLTLAASTSTRPSSLVREPAR